MFQLLFLIIIIIIIIIIILYYEYHCYYFYYCFNISGLVNFSFSIFDTLHFDSFWGNSMYISDDFKILLICVCDLYWYRKRTNKKNKKKTLKVKSLHKNQTHSGNLTKNSFYNLLRITMCKSFFTFDERFYKQYDGGAIVMMQQYPLGPALANVFMCCFENICLENCPTHFKPIFYRQFVGDTFLIFQTKIHVVKFRNYLNE